MAALQSRLQQRVDASGIDAAVAVTDLQTGETVSVNGDEPHLTGCTINFFVLLQVVRDLEAGPLPRIGRRQRHRRHDLQQQPGHGA